MSFVPGDRVHRAGIGTGIIREARGAGRFAVEIKGRIVIAAAGDLELADPPGKPRKHRAPSRTQPHQAAPGAPGAPGPLIDLHGKSVDEAVAAVEVWVNETLLAGHGAARAMLRSGPDGSARRLPASRSVVAGVGASALLLVAAMLAGGALFGALGTAGGVVANVGIAALAGMLATVLAAKRRRSYGRRAVVGDVRPTPSS